MIAIKNFFLIKENIPMKKTLSLHKNFMYIIVAFTNTEPKIVIHLIANCQMTIKKDSELANLPFLHLK